VRSPVGLLAVVERLGVSSEEPEVDDIAYATRQFGDRRAERRKQMGAPLEIRRPAPQLADGDRRDVEEGELPKDV
jgi:hypothetical protein